MGYNTKFYLDVLNGNLSEILPVLKTLNDNIDSYIDDDGESYDMYKWYDRDVEMIEISKMYPHLIFSLKGEGEDAGDIWIHYYKNGKIQKCPAIIAFDEFDENKLAEW